MMGVTTTAAGLKPRRAVKIEKPRPLKLCSSFQSTDHHLESVLSEMDLVTQSLQSGVWDQRVLYPSITSLCENLKMFGPQLENVYKDQLDKCYIWLRTGCRDDRLSLAARYRLLEIIELRAMNWKPNQNLISYYQTKLQHIEAEEAAMEEQTELAAYMTSPQANQLTAAALAAATMSVTSPMQTPTTPSAAPMFQPHMQYQPYPQQTLLAAQPQTLLYSHYNTAAGIIPVEQYQQVQQQHQQQVAVVPAVPMLSPGEVVRTSGKFSKPTRIAGKNYCKDEVVIRNQDSGKVMGIKGRRVHMIEELSETIISFQRVAPGARERLVQITGPSEENIAQAKQLIEDTIRRNASPVRESHSLSSGGSSVFSSSPLNGSNSSIASHTDDDNNSLNGCKRNTLVHSMSMVSGSDSGVCGGSDACMGDYRYTVSHNNNAIRITGNNLKMVRTAKLVLDEYFNGDRNLNNINQLLNNDGFESTTTTTTTTTTPSGNKNVGNLTLNISSSNSNHHHHQHHQDQIPNTTTTNLPPPLKQPISATNPSPPKQLITTTNPIPPKQLITTANPSPPKPLITNTITVATAPPIPKPCNVTIPSSSPQTYSSSSSSPPMLVKPATPPATPPPTVGEGNSPDGKDSNSSSGGTKGDESPKNGGVGIVRQPLFPSSSKEAIEVADGNNSTSNSARSRRSAFAKTSDERNSSSVDDVACDDGGGGVDGGAPPPQQRKAYSRQEIVDIAAAEASKLTPLDWDSVINNTPELIKKGSAYLGGVVATMNEHGQASINGAPTYLQPVDLMTPASFSSDGGKWVAPPRTNSFNDEDNNTKTSQ